MGNKKEQLIEVLTQLKDSMDKLSTILDTMGNGDLRNAVIDSYVDATFDQFDIPTYELNDIIQEFCEKSIVELKKE